MSESQINNERIAHNTVFLYIRMLFTIFVSLYTSRVILQTLGIVDYGIYNVIGGIAALFSFITASMSQTIQRFITFELGKGDKGNVNKVFSVGMEMQFVISIIIMLLVEVVGLWMIENKLQIPEDRVKAAYYILQFSVLTIPISLLSSPYNALIIAYEKMKAFAFISVFEVSAKLVIAYSLMITSFDHLILYGFLYMIVMAGIQMCYVTYCKRNLSIIRFKYTVDTNLTKRMISFGSWNMYGALAFVGFTQGLNILLNTFFLPAVNAARGIAVQVQSTLYGFVLNFQTAINPQITKTYAGGNLSEMHKLIIRSAKFSFMLLAMLSIPVLLEAPLLLKLWLKDVPDHTIVFVRIIVLTSWITSIENPITYAVQASGKIKRYQFIVSTIRLSIVPVSYIFLTFGFPAHIVFIVHFCVDLCAIVVRLKLLQPIIGFPINRFIKQAVMKNLVSITFAFMIVLPMYKFFEASVWRLALVSFTSVIIVAIVSYLFVLDNSEKKFICSIIFKFLPHK